MEIKNRSRICLTISCGLGFLGKVLIFLLTMRRSRRPQLIELGCYHP